MNHLEPVIKSVGSAEPALHLWYDDLYLTTPWSDISPRSMSKSSRREDVCRNESVEFVRRSSDGNQRSTHNEAVELYQRLGIETEQKRNQFKFGLIREEKPVPARSYKTIASLQSEELG